MPCTVDAEALTKMNDNGEITGCVVDGPLSLDMAIDEELPSIRVVRIVRLPVMRMYFCSRISTPATSYIRL